MKRRVCQAVQHVQDDKLRFVCNNNLELSWDEAYAKLSEAESQHKPLWPLTMEEMLDIGRLIHNSAVMRELDLLRMFELHQRQ